MQGLGNDFLVFDAPAAAQAGRIDSNMIRALADRHTGVGFDQALMLEPPRDSRSRVFYRIFNSDGGEVEQCGNGARCIAALMYARQPELGRDLVMDSAGGIVRARVREDGLVAVDMGMPNFEPRSLPMEAAAESPAYSLEIDGADIEFGAVSMGNPHVVLRVPDVSTAPRRTPRACHRKPSAFCQIAPMWASCKSSIATTSGCGSTSAGRERRWRAAPAPVRQPPSASRAGYWSREVRVDLPGGDGNGGLARAGPAFMADGPGDAWCLPDRSIFNGS